MYTNIDTEEGIAAIKRWLELFLEEIPEDFPPVDCLLEILRTVMTQNVFSFGDTYWMQVVGTAMGTPCACSYATLTYGLHERITLLPKHSVVTRNFLKRFIDDMFGLWYDPLMPLDLEEEDEKTWIESSNKWKEFVADLPSLGLSWTAETPSRKVNFLDLTLSIRNGVIHSTTYQKWMNLYLYIPPHSAHPASCFKGLVFGILQRYWQQNTDRADFTKFAGLFFNRLLARGHAENDIAPLFRQAATHIDWKDKFPDLHIMKKTAKGKKRKDTLYLPWRFHPTGTSTRVVRNLYETHLEGHTLKESLVVSQSRPRNLRDLLMSNTFRCVGDNEQVSYIFKQYRDTV